MTKMPPSGTPPSGTPRNDSYPINYKSLSLYHKFMRSKGTYEGKIIKMKEVYNCTSVSREKDLQTFLSRIKFFLVHHVWLDDSTLNQVTLLETSKEKLKNLQGYLESHNTKNARVTKIFTTLLTQDEKKTIDNQGYTTEFHNVDVAHLHQQVNKKKQEEQEALKDEVDNLAQDATQYAMGLAANAAPVLNYLQDTIKKEVKPIINSAVGNFNQFCLNHVVSSNDGRRVFNSLPDDQKKSFLMLHNTRKELESLRTEEESYKTKLSYYWDSDYKAKSDARTTKIQDLEAKEKQLLEHLEPVKEVLQKDALNPMVSEMQKQVVHVFSTFYTSLAKAQQKVRSENSHFDQYPLNYQQYLIAVAMADVDPGATDVVCVPEMSDEERESYSEYVQENLKNQDLQRSDIKDPVALGESNQKLQQLSDKVSVIEKRLGEELAKGDKEKEKKFFEKGFSQVVIDKILFPGGVKLNYITPEAMGVQSLKDKVVSEILTALGLGANPAQALKKIVSDKTLSMVVDSMSNPEQLYSMAGSYASSTATAIAKYEKRQKVLSDVNQESVEINENIKKSEARLQSLEGKSKQIQEQIDILNEKKKASGAEAIVRGEKIKTEAFLEAQKLKVAKEEELDKKQKVKEELEVKLTQNEAKVENHRKDFASKEKELEKANQTLKERENPGWISWMAGYGTPESIAEAREEVETASETKTASQQEFTKAQDESNRLQTEIGNLEDELIEEEAKLRRPFNFELSAADLKNLEQQVIEEVNEELTVLEQEMLELSQHVDGENTQLKSLKTDKENLQTSLSKANTKLSKVSYVVERQVTDEMLIANLIGKKEAPAGVKEDIKQASLSLLQLTAPKTALILGSLGQLSGYDELYADQVETYLSRTLNQFAFQMDERALAKGYEQLADTLSAKRASFKAPLEDEGVSASEAEDSKTEASKTEVPEIEGPKVDTREQLRNDTNKIIEFYMGSTPAFVTQHVASSVNEAYNLFQNPALNRLLICQLLAGMAKAVEETQSQQVA